MVVLGIVLFPLLILADSSSMLAIQERRSTGILSDIIQDLSANDSLYTQIESSKYAARERLEQHRIFETTTTAMHSTGLVQDQLNYSLPVNLPINSRESIVQSDPDLTPVKLTAPATVAPGQPMTITWSVENQGAGGAYSGWTDRVYFSIDDVWGEDDIALHESWHEVLAPSEVYTQTETVWMGPAPAGTYYLILKTDADDFLPESNEDNNERAIAISVTVPDLASTALTIPDTVTAGQLVTVTWTVANQGPGTAYPGWVDRFYLSTDDVWDEDDTPIGEFGWEEAVSSQESYSQTQTVRIPGEPPGDYYLILRADADNFFIESDETNNDRTELITLTMSDLVPTTLTVPAEVASGQPVTVTWTVENQGIGEAHPGWEGWYDELYISVDNVWDHQDLPIGGGFWYNNQSVAPGDSYSQTRTIALPQLPAGNYFLILRVDDPNSLFESDENNNERSTPLTVTTADLTPTALAAPSQVAAGQPVTITWTVENQGLGGAYPGWEGWTDRFYLSTDDVWDEGDMWLDEFSWNEGVASGESYSQTQMIWIPQVPAGQYYLLLHTDDNNTLFESDETNNERIVATSVNMPDLTPTALTMPATVSAGQLVTITWTVENRGAVGAQLGWSGWNDRIYFSTDGVWDEGDVQIGEFWWYKEVSPGTSYSRTQAIPIPEVPAGDYHLILRTDADNALYEFDEANNDRVASVTLAISDLVPTMLVVPEALATIQQQIEVSWIVQNHGAGEAHPPWHDRLYLSSDEVWDDQDMPLDWGPEQAELLAPGASYTQTRTVWLPEMQPSNYYLILRVDDSNDLYESNEANNDTQRPIRIQEAEAVNSPWRALDSGGDGVPTLGSLDFSPDGTRLVAAGANQAFIWEIPTGDLRSRFTAHTAPIDTVDFSPDGDQILSGAADGTSRIWDSATRQQIRSFAAATGQPNPAVFSLDGTEVLAGSGLNLPRLWNAISGEELRTFSGHTEPVIAVALSPDGEKALTGSVDTTAILWDAETGERLLTVSRHDEMITAVEFSPDGTQFLTSSIDGSIRLWDVASGDQTSVFFQGSPVVSAVFSPDGKHIISCDDGWPGRAYLWDISSGAIVRTFSESEDGFGGVNGVAVSPDQTAIATSHSDGQIRLWQSGLGAIPLHPITPLSVGSELSLTLRSHGLYYFEINTAPARNLLITLGSEANQATLQNQANDGALRPDTRFGNLAAQVAKSLDTSTTDPTAVHMVVGRGSLPSVYEYDYLVQAAVPNLHSEIPIAPTSGGKYYVLIFAPFLSEGNINASIRADYSDFHISDIAPESGGAGGEVTVQIQGTGFSASTVAQLVASDGSIIAGEIQLLVNPAEMFVTFNLQDAATGVYDVRIEDGEKVEIREDAFEVSSIVPGHVQVRLNAPNAVRPGREGTLTVDYSNPGNTDVPAPLLRITAEGAELRLPEQTEFLGSSIQLFATHAGGPVGVLSPGASGRISLIFRPTGSGNSVSFSVSKVVP